MLIAIQVANEFGIAIPPDWQYPCDEVIVTTVGSCKTAKERMESTDPDVTC